MFGNGNDYGNGLIMPVAPMGYGYGGGNGGFGFGGDGIWGGLLLGLLFGGLGGWGGFGGFGGGWGNMFGMDAMMLAPYFFNTQTQNDVNRGFDNSGLSNQIASVQNSIENVRTGNQLSDIQNAIASGFSSAEVANCNRAFDSLQTAYANQIADLNRSFAAQTAVDSRLDTLDMALQQCCCDQRLDAAQLQNVIQTENAADRAALSDGVRDIIASQTAGTQRILDQLCNDKIDAKNERIAELQAQVNMQNLAASQAAQTAALVADNNAQTATLINRIAPYPQASYLVGNPYGFGNGFGWGGCNNNGWNNGFGFNPFGNVGFGNGSF